MFAARVYHEAIRERLGLHSAANFVIASGGRIQPVSEGAGEGAGKRTTMRVMLPLSSVAPVAPSHRSAGTA